MRTNVRVVFAIGLELLRCEEEDLLGLKFENLVQALSGKRNAVPKAHASLDDFLRKAMTWNIKKKLRELDEAYEGERG